MSAELMGVSVTRLEEPIGQALRTYEEVSDNGLMFDSDKASKLELTPDKPNSARSVTDVTFMTEKIGSLYVIAFKPGDGTGDESAHKLASLRVDRPYPRSTLIVPRSKAGVHSEVNLTIVRHSIEDVHAEPEKFAGTFDLLGLDIERVTKIGELGHLATEKYPIPVATLTVGYGEDGKRFGDPHAVYNGISDAIQVCAFLAISDAVHTKYQNVLDGLRPQFPRRSK
jgi:hypothetical protein